MPSRILSLTIIGFWLFTTAWMATKEWIPWLIADDFPFEVELADEAAPQQALWSLWQNDKTIGDALTTLQYRRDDTMDWTSQLMRITQQFRFGTFQLKAEVPRLLSTMRLNRRGELLRIETTGEIMVDLGFRIQASFTMTGKVEEGKLSGDFEVESNLGKFASTFDPVPIQQKSVFTPLMPLNRLRGLYPGRTWRMSRFDPLSQAVTEIVQQQLKAAQKKAKSDSTISIPGLPKEGTEILAEVLPQKEKIVWKQKEYECWVIQYRSDNVDAKTWVDANDDRIIRQEATQGGVTLFLQRED